MVSNRYTILNKCQFQLKLKIYLRRNYLEKKKEYKIWDLYFILVWDICSILTDIDKYI